MYSTGLHIQTTAANVMLGTVPVDFDDFEPQERDRCNTWPLRKPSRDFSQNTSPLIHEQIPEETEGSLHGSRDDFLASPNSQTGRSSTGGSPLSSALGAPGCGTPANAYESDQSFASGKKATTRRNAWGNMSYADLITQAILNSPERRLTLSQIYDWMVQNVPYFQDKGDSNSSAGWKNSIRHNLSLHSRFMRIQNEGAGKSSWWVINPDAKPGKPRRRANTLESKPAERKRGRIKKKVEQLLGAADARSAGSLNEPPVGTDSPDNSFYDYDDYSGFAEFRKRSDSNLSNYSTPCANRLSPQFEEEEDISTWAGLAASLKQEDLVPDIAQMAHEMHLADQQAAVAQSGCSPHHAAAQQSFNRPPQRQNFVSGQKHFPPLSNLAPVAAGYAPRMAQPVTLKMEPAGFSPTCAQSYHELSPHQPGVCLRHFAENGSRGLTHEYPAYQELYPASASEMRQSNPSMMCALQKAQQQPQFYREDPAFSYQTENNSSKGRGSPYSTPVASGRQQLPSDISDIQFDRVQSHDVECDIDAVLRHEMKVAGKLDFNMDFDSYGN